MYKRQLVDVALREANRAVDIEALPALERFSTYTGRKKRVVVVVDALDRFPTEFQFWRQNTWN